MKDAKPVSTHFASYFKLSTAQSPQSSKKEDYMARISFSSAVGSIMYVIVYTPLEQIVLLAEICLILESTLASCEMDYQILVRHFKCLFGVREK
jgi:hypothetical protein